MFCFAAKEEGIEEETSVIAIDLTLEELAYARALARAYGYGDDVGRFIIDLALDRLRIVEGES